MSDKINPEHYKIGGIETIDYIKAKLTPEEYLGYLKGTQIKYRARIGYKEGEDAISDIDKMDWYRDKEKEIYITQQQDIKTKVMLEMQEQELHDED
jgi:hypothetical protein